MKASTPTDGCRKRLRRESAQRCGKCNPAKDSPDKGPSKKSLCKVSSIREGCIGARIMRGQKVIQNLHHWLSEKYGFVDKSKSTDRWRRRRVVRKFWNGGDSRGEMSEVRRLCKEKEVRLGGISTLKLAERAPRIDTWRASRPASLELS